MAGLAPKGVTAPRHASDRPDRPMTAANRLTGRCFTELRGAGRAAARWAATVIFVVLLQEIARIDG
ncbi:hypothetical protein Tamer19_10070 [Cupriavidus sp. TA19]|nr:hypothetical protein Tamer19_10070 [Cupriavidus sp. TA19]